MSYQEFVQIENSELLSNVLRMKNENYRLVQICVTRVEQFVFTYSFEKDYRFINLIFKSDYNEPIESIEWLYPYAFLYENEMKDLFGVIINNMNLDYKGNFYKTSVKTPFNPEDVTSTKDSHSKVEAPVNHVEKEVN